MPAWTSGDREAEIRARVGEYFEQYFDAVFGFCVVRCNSRPLAEEICSDVFADAVRQLQREPDAQLESGWFMSVARRRMIDHWRRSERHRNRLERLSREPEPVAVGPEVIIGGEVDDDRVLRALASLPDRQRAALTARYVDGWSVDEVAEALDASYRAAESLLSRARRSFAAAYRSEGGDR